MHSLLKEIVEPSYREPTSRHLPPTLGVREKLTGYVEDQWKWRIIPTCIERIE
jgi:hypothetical protein